MIFENYEEIYNNLVNKSLALVEELGKEEIIKYLKIKWANIYF